MFSWKQIERSPLVIAHRGASGSAPENTLAAFEQAIQQGADAIELDVRLSKDKEVVVFHDATLQRTTNGRGYVRNHTLTELKKLDAGSWFGPSFRGERIPTLGEVFQFVNERVGINIEVKHVLGAQASREIVHHCLKVIERFQASGYVLVSSFQHSLLRLVRKENPDVAIGILYHPLHLAAQSPSRLLRKVEANFFVCGMRFLRRRMVADVHRHAIAVAAYTINTEPAVRRCLALGIKGIITNVPEKVITLCGRNRSGM